MLSTANAPYPGDLLKWTPPNTRLPFESKSLGSAAPFRLVRSTHRSSARGANSWLGEKRCSVSRRKGAAQFASVETFADQCAAEFLIHGFFLFLCCVPFATADVTAATSGYSSLRGLKWSPRTVLIVTRPNPERRSMRILSGNPLHELQCTLPPN